MRLLHPFGMEAAYYYMYYQNVCVWRVVDIQCDGELGLVTHYLHC